MLKLLSHVHNNQFFQLKLQVERVTGSNRELRRKHRSLQSQVRTLCDERADFLVQLQDQQRSIGALRQRLGLAQKENEDLAKSDVSFMYIALLFCHQSYRLTYLPIEISQHSF